MSPLLLALLAASQAEGAAPIALHPQNPHYLAWRGKPTVLVTSGEHYGAVLNLDFDYLPYLDELQAHGLNLTRTFSGVYCESAKSFGIKGNPLAPKSGRLVCPWARSDQPGYANGGNKFDLTRYDEAYFERLKDFLAQAGRRGIVVEFVLFCPFYKDEMWRLSPMNAANNVNGIGACPRTEVYTLKHKKLLAAHEALVRKVVAELRDVDNLTYEVCNEPYFGGVSLRWQHRIIDAIVDAEKSFPHKHLIAQNIANGKKKVRNPHPAVSIFNFHYATPPDTVAMNYGLEKVIADDETGFKGHSDFIYRAEGWDFLVAGGAIYSNLDYSFTPDHEDGSAKPRAPGGGGRTLRRQLAILKRFIEGFDFVRMAPHDEIVKGGVPEKATARVLAEPGKQYALYLRGGREASLRIELPAGAYEAEWVNTRTGEVDRSETFRHPGGERRLDSPPYAQDTALRILRAGD
ncbi:MAG: hypothetical protein ACLF0G_01315 [Candidatus Brocadiia bacterium]